MFRDNLDAFKAFVADSAPNVNTNLEQWGENN